MAYRLIVPTLSNQVVVYDTLDSLLYGIREVLEEDGRDTITIEHVDLSPEQIDALPEFEGY